MSVTIGILVFIIVILLTCLLDESASCSTLRNNLWKTKEELQNAKELILQYEDRNNGISRKEKELDKKIINMMEAARKDADSIILQANMNSNEKIAEANRTADEILEKANQDYKNRVFEAGTAYYKQKAEISKKEIELKKRELEIEEKEINIKILQQNLVALPYMASIIADFDTRGLELLAQKLDWGKNVERAKKVASIRELRRASKEELAKYKEAQYQLDYAITMFPALTDFLETDYRSLHAIDLSNISDTEHDASRDYLSKEEYTRLSSAERNQLALDRYRESRKKTNWQIGRDYEIYIGYLLEKKGFSVDYFGSYNGLEDLGRDLIAKKGCCTLIVQCKYWSSSKKIHEKHINQLYGTMICYCFEHNVPKETVKAVLITNIYLSETAQRFANYLGVSYAENVELGNYPCIKCNVNRSEYGEVTKIYHLPFDQQYDSCKINSPGEFFAMTVAEAEAAGFRRAYRWHG